MTHVIGRGRYRGETYPNAGFQRVGQVPSEIVRYSFAITTAMADKTIVPIANQLGALPQDRALITNVPALLFVLPGGVLGRGNLVVISDDGNTGSKIDLQFIKTTVAAPIPVPIGSLKVGVIDPARPGGVIGSQIDCTDVVSPAGGAFIGAQFIIPSDVIINSTLYVSLSVGALWDPATINNPPA